jgi:hypothetical protein
MRAPYSKAFIYLALCATLTDCVPAENAFSDVPILNCSGLPCVQVRLEGGPPIRLVLDFSSLASYVSRSAVRNQHLGISGRAQMGSVVLKDRFVVVDPTSEESLAQIGRNGFPGGDGGLSFRAFADRLFVLDLPHQRLRIWNGDSPKPVCPSHCGKLVLARQGDFASVEIWAADSFSLNNRPVTALIDPLYPGAVIASQTIEGLIRPERRGNRFYVPGVATNRKYDEERLFFVGSIFVTFAGRTICTSTALNRYDDQLFGIYGNTYQATIGRAILAKFPIAFDLRNAQMWIADPNARALGCD